MTSKQFYIIFMVFIISLKVQKLPGLVYEVLNNNSYILFIAYFLIDIVAILLAFFVLKILRKSNFLLNGDGGKVSLLAKVGLFFVALYFLLQGTLFYEAIQNLFSHVLFDNLPWTLFSLLLIACVFYLAATGIKNIARNFELYFFIIIVSYIILAVFGALRTDFSNIFPLEKIDFPGTVKHFLDFNIWFGDFFLVLFLGANAKDVKLKWTLLFYAISAVYVVLLVIEFNGIYLSYTSSQSGLITMLSEQSMLGLDIGRIDWFLILITEIGTILCSGLCFHFARNCLSLVVPKIKSNYILIVLVAALYFLDVFFLVDTHIKEIVFLNFAGIFAIVIKSISFFALICASLKRLKQTKSSKAEQGKAEETLT